MRGVNTAVDMNTAVVFTASDRSNTGSSSINYVFGNPNDYVWKLGNLSAYTTNFPLHGKAMTNRLHDKFRAVAVDSETSGIYFGSNALGRICLSLYIANNDTRDHYYFAPPITKVVIIPRRLYSRWREIKRLAPSACLFVCFLSAF